MKTPRDKILAPSMQPLRDACKFSFTALQLHPVAPRIAEREREGRKATSF